MRRAGILALVVDAFFIPLYLFLGVSFRATKNVCGYENPFWCYAYFVTIITALLVANNLINFCILNKRIFPKLLVAKVVIYGIPLLIFSLVRAF